MSAKYTLALLMLGGIFLAICILWLGIIDLKLEKLSSFVIIATLASISIHLLANRQSNWLRIDTVFIISYLIVFFQWPIMNIYFDLTPIHGFQKDALNSPDKILVISAVGMVAFLLGYNLPYVTPRLSRIDHVRYTNLLPLALLVSILGFAVSAGSEFFSRSVYIHGADSIINTVSGASSYLLNITEIFARLSVAVLLYTGSYGVHRLSLASASRSGKHAVLLFGLIIFCSIFLLGGERGQVVMVILSLALGYAATSRPVGLFPFILLMTTGFLVFSLIGIIRAGFGAGIEFAATFGYWELSTDLAQSFVTLNYALMISESLGQPEFGQVLLSQALGVIPFLQGIFFDLTSMRVEEANSALMITTFVFGPNARSGLGTSIIADLFLAFGTAGIPAGMIALGYFSKYMQRWLVGDCGFTRFYLATIFGGFILYLARSSILFPSRPMLWGLLILLIMCRPRRLH